MWLVARSNRALRCLQDAYQRSCTLRRALSARTHPEGRFTCAHPPNVLRVCGIPDRPVIHGHLRLLCLPDRIHQTVDGTLPTKLGRAVQNWHPQNNASSSSSRFSSSHLLELFCDDLLSVELRDAVEVAGPGRCVYRVRRISLGSREDVVGADVEECDRAGCAEACERARRIDIESSSSGWIRGANVGRALGRTLDGRQY